MLLSSLCLFSFVVQLKAEELQSFLLSFNMDKRFQPPAATLVPNDSTWTNFLSLIFVFIFSWRISFVYLFIFPLRKLRNEGVKMRFGWESILWVWIVLIGEWISMWTRWVMTCETPFQCYNKVSVSQFWK